MIPGSIDPDSLSFKSSTTPIVAKRRLAKVKKAVMMKGGYQKREDPDQV